VQVCTRCRRPIGRGRLGNRCSCTAATAPTPPTPPPAGAEAVAAEGVAEAGVAARWDAAVVELADMLAAASVGLGRIVALHHRSSTSYHICEHIRFCLPSLPSPPLPSPPSPRLPPPLPSLPSPPLPSPPSPPPAPPLPSPPLPSPALQTCHFSSHRLTPPCPSRTPPSSSLIQATASL
jgi:hypothetical protein